MRIYLQHIIAIHICNAYQIIKIGTAQTLSDQACQDTFGTRLASIHSASDQTDVVNLCGNGESCWLGGEGGSMNGCVWNWYDGSVWNYNPTWDTNQGCQNQYLCIWMGSPNLHDCGGVSEFYYPICNDHNLYVPMVELAPRFCLNETIDITNNSLFVFDLVMDSFTAGSGDNGFLHIFDVNAQYFYLRYEQTKGMYFGIDSIDHVNYYNLKTPFDSNDVGISYHHEIFVTQSTIIIIIWTIDNIEVLNTNNKSVYLPSTDNSVCFPWTLGRVGQGRVYNFTFYNNLEIILNLRPSLSIAPSNAPSDAPSLAPTSLPSKFPTTPPSIAPSITPTTAPTNNPSMNPTSPTSPPSLAPSKMPTSPPSNAPSIAPSMNPTFSPSNAPSLAPSKMPTSPPSIAPSITPTTAPTNNPSMNPTSPPSLTPSKMPTSPPSNAPLVNPSISPSFAPTQSPSIAPTYIPTFDPTNNPTSLPSNAPSFAPTVSPTQAPTRLPTSDREYDSFFIITYLIKDLEDRFINILINNILQITDDIIEKIEQAYFETTLLKYKFFMLHIEDFLGIEIQNINQDKYVMFANAQERITIKTKIDCGKQACKVLSGSKFYEKYVDEFESIATNKLRQYFDNYAIKPSELIFEILSYGQFQVLYPTEPIPISQIISQNKILIILGCILIVTIIISFCAWIHSKITQIDSIWYAPFIYGIQCVAILIDINICIAIISNDDNDDNDELFMSDLRITICGISSIIFILIPYYTNIYFGGKVLTMIPKQNENAISFFKYRRKFCMCFIGMCGGCYPSIFLLSSNIFGLNFFNCGLLNYELKKMSKIKIISTIILQHIPQIIIQCTYTAAIHMILPNIVFAFSISILSIISTPISIKTLNNNHFSYQVEITMVSNSTGEIGDTYNEQRKKFESNKGKTKKMREILCQAFKREPKDMQISRNSKVDICKITLYIMQFVDNNNNMNVHQVAKLYLEKQAFLKDRFQKHFDLNGECKITFKYGNNKTNMDTDMDKFDGLDYNSIHDKQKFLTTNLALSNDGGEIKMDTYNEIENNVEMQLIKPKKQSLIFDNMILDQKQETIINDIFNQEKDEQSESDIDFAV